MNTIEEETREILFEEIKSENLNPRRSQLIKYGTFLGMLFAIIGLFSDLSDLFPRDVADSTSIPIYALSLAFVVSMIMIGYLINQITTLHGNFSKSQEYFRRLQNVSQSVFADNTLKDIDTSKRIGLMKDSILSTLQYITDHYHLLQEFPATKTKLNKASNQHMEVLGNVLAWGTKVFAVMTGCQCYMTVKTFNSETMSEPDISERLLFNKITVKSYDITKPRKAIKNHKVSDNSLLCQLVAGEHEKLGHIYEEDLNDPEHGKYRVGYELDWENFYNSTLIFSLRFSSDHFRHKRNDYLQGYLLIEAIKPDKKENKIFTEDIVYLMEIISKLCYSILGMEIESKAKLTPRTKK